MKHYLMTTDEHFDAAIRGDNRDVDAEKKAAQQPHATGGNEPQERLPVTKKPRFFRGLRRLAA